MVVVKYYSEEFEEKHISFAKKYWTKRRRFTPEYIYWKFRGKDKEELKSFILAFDGDEVVGQFGLIPCKLGIKGQFYEAQWACDLMVDDRYRGKGVAEKLYEFAHQNCLITLGSDPSPAAEKSMLRKGYKCISGPRKFVFPIKIGEIFKLKGFNFKILNHLYNPFYLLIKLGFHKKFNLINPIEYSLLKRQLAKKTIYCFHDDNFIDWRFNSFKDYYSGVECYKYDESNFFSGYYADGFYFITEFYCSSISKFLSMTSFVCSKYENLLRIKFVSNEAKISKIIPFLGFVRFSTLTNIVLFSLNNKIMDEIKGEKMYYTLLDSDENI